jgi:diguanylate cyclase (GGDEF)-like protein
MNNLADNNNDNDKVLEKKLITIRLVACFISLTLVHVSGYYNNMYYYDLTLLLYLAYNLGLWAYVSRKPNTRLVAYSVYIDILIISVLISLRGGIRSDLYGVYFVVLSYTLAKKQKNLIITTAALILVAYAASCILFSDLSVYSYGRIIGRLLIRVSIMMMAIFIMFNIKAEMNYSSMLSQKAYEMALIDPLTRVYNRNMLNTLNAYQKQNPYNLSFAMIDIDDFKIINDTLGHQKGDEALSLLGDVIRKNIRTDDICIRFGGEEFLLAFKNTNDDSALKILERIKTVFSEHVFTYNGSEISCTISAGLAYGMENTDINTIISYADNALYQAKHKGKNNITVYSCAS